MRPDDASGFPWQCDYNTQTLTVIITENKYFIVKTIVNLLINMVNLLTNMVNLLINMVNVSML